jgi:hypothetical protein
MPKKTMTDRAPKELIIQSEDLIAEETIEVPNARTGRGLRAIHRIRRAIFKRILCSSSSNSHI